METVTSLSTRQVIDHMFLMTLLSSRNGGRSKLLDRVMATVAAQPGGEKTYDVEIRVNGVALDFADFTAEVQRQLDEMVMSAARKLLDERLADRIVGIIEQCHDAERAAKDLRNALEAEMRKVRGLPPRQSENDG